MPKILILYYSRSGNTEKMAKAVAEGAKNPNVTVELTYQINAEELPNYDAILIGTPTYNALMPRDLQSLLEEVLTKQINLKGKVGSAFGSYGWSGEAPPAVIELLSKFEMQVIEPPILSRYVPDQKVLANCVNLGKTVVSKLNV